MALFVEKATKDLAQLANSGPRKHCRRGWLILMSTVVSVVEQVSEKQEYHN